MKTRMFGALVATLLVAGRTDAGVDKAQLRKLVRLPEVDVSAGVYFSTTFGFVFNGETPDPLAEIARLQQQLKGDARDVECYLQMGRLYFHARREKEAREVHARAVALCRQQVREHPDDMSWLARLGEALIWADQEKEAEPILRRAIKDAPNEWRAWLALGECLDCRAIQMAFGDKGVTFHYLDEKVVISALREQQLTAKQVADMRRLWKEARRCHDRAVELAPAETKPYFHRIRSNISDALSEMGLRGDKEEVTKVLAAVFTPENTADMSRIARLTPENAKNIGGAILVEFMACLLHPKKDGKGTASPPANGLGAKDSLLPKFLSAESRERMTWGMERLELLAKNSDGATAAAAAEILAEVLMVIKSTGESQLAPFSHQLEEFKKDVERMRSVQEARRAHLSPIGEMDGRTAKMVQLLRRAIQLDPSRERSWDMLTGLLVVEWRSAEALAAALDRIKLKDNAHNRFLAAKIYARGGQFKKATEHLRAGLQQDANDWRPCRS